MTKFQRALIEVTIAAPAEEVWRALRDPARIAQWFGWDTESLAAEIEYIFLKHGRADDAHRTLVFARREDRFEVEAKGDSCIVRFMRSAPAEGTDWEDIFEDETQGWIAFIQQLRFALDRHPQHVRRTLFLSGSPLVAGGPLAGAALGLPGGAPGTAYAITAPMGDALAGRVWHRGRHQVGVTVDGVGDGLLVVMDRQPDAKLSTGHSQVIATTYGLDDRTFEELAARWRTWWSAHFDSKLPGCA